jgi:hypothetical protein
MISASHRTDAVETPKFGAAIDNDRDLRHTALAVAFFLIGCAVYLAVTVPIAIEFWDPFVATIGTGPVSVVLVLVGTVVGASAIRSVVRLVNKFETS